MSLYASNMTCYCVNLSYDEFIARISEDEDKYRERLRDYSGNYLYFENPDDLQDYPGKIHHDLVIVNDRGELTRIGGNLYIDKDENNEKGFFEYDSRTHEVKIDRTKIREINGDLTIGKYKSIKVQNKNVTITGEEIKVQTEQGSQNYNVISGKGPTTRVGVSPDKLYLGDVLLKDMLDKDDLLDKRTQSLISELNSWPNAVMNLYPAKSSLVSSVVSYTQNNIDGKFVFSATRASTNTQEYGQIEILNVMSMYHLYSDVLKNTNIFYIYVGAQKDKNGEEYVNFYISPMYFNYIYVDSKYDSAKEYMNDATHILSDFSSDNNIYYKYSVKCPSNVNSASDAVLKVLYGECSKDTVDRDKMRFVPDILSEYNRENPTGDFRGLSMTFKFRHVGFINVTSEINTTIIPATNSYYVSAADGRTELKNVVGFFTETNNKANPQVSSSNTMAGSKAGLSFNKYMGVDKDGDTLFNRTSRDYSNTPEDLFNSCDETKELLGRINRVFKTFGDVLCKSPNDGEPGPLTAEAKKYFYTSQKTWYTATNLNGEYYADINYYKPDPEDTDKSIMIPKGSTFTYPEYGLYESEDQDASKVFSSELSLAYTLLSPDVTAWSYSNSTQVALETLKENTTVHTWYNNIIKRPIVRAEASVESNNKLSKYEFTVEDFKTLNTTPIDYSKIFRYRLDDNTEWSNWMCLNNASIRFNEDNFKLTIQVPSVGWCGNLGASGVFMLSDLYRNLKSNKTIAQSTFGDIKLNLNTSGGDNQKILQWINQSFTDAQNAVKIPKTDKEDFKNFSMADAITVNNKSYTGLLFSNALFMNIRNRMLNPQWTDEEISDGLTGIDETLTNFFTFKNVTGAEEKETDATRNYYLAEYTISLENYPITSRATNLNFKYVAIATHNDRYLAGTPDKKTVADVNII